MKGFVYITLAILILLGSTAPVSAGGVISCMDVTEIPLLECDALVRLFMSTNGPNWRINWNWLLTDTPSNWYGVLVTSGHVTGLQLFDISLFGYLPPELGNLTSLTYLDLGLNWLVGTIPPELGNLTNFSKSQIQVKHESGRT